MLIKAAFFAASVMTVLLYTQPATASLRRVCYYTNWAQYRNGKGRYVPENVDPFMCTHYIYAFSAFDENNRIRAFEWNDESQPWAIGMYEQFNQLKLKNPALKTLLAVGGWNVGSGPFTQMVATQQSRARFIESAIEFVRKWGFDGLDVDWEYPANRGSPPEDRDNFTFLIKELRAAFESESLSTGRPRLLLSAAVGAGKSKIDTAYNIPALMLYLDFASIMSYDLHGAWETHTGHHTALFPRSDETGDDRYLNVDFAVNYWVQLGAPKEKLNVGLSTYWRTFTLSSTSQTGLGVPVSARNGGCTDRRKRASWPTTNDFIVICGLCDSLLQFVLMCVRHAEQWRPEHQDREQFVPYVTKGDQWAGGDDVASITTKTCYVKQHGFGGVMVWTPDDDDFSGTSCPEGKYPLMTAIIKELNNPSFANCPGVIPPTDKCQQKVYPYGRRSIPNGLHITHIYEVDYFFLHQLAQWLLSDPLHCDQYFACVSQVAYGVKCEQGKRYNRDKQDCVVSVGDCPSSRQPPTIPPSTSPIGLRCQLLVQRSEPQEKLNIGWPPTGDLHLSSPYQTGLGAQAKGPGKEGPQTRTEGFLAYYEVCDIMHQGGQMHEDPEQYVRYISNGDQWAGGEDIVSITKKTCYIKQHGFGGVMVWAPDLDDFSGTSCQEGTYPLMNAVIKELNSPSYGNCPSHIILPVSTTRYPTPQLHTTQPPWHVDTTHPPYIPLETWVPPYTTNPPHTPSPSSGHGLSEIYDFSCMNLHNGFYPNSQSLRTSTYDFAVNYWVQLGAPKEKLNVGLSTYWRTFTLSSLPDRSGGSSLGARKRGCTDRRKERPAYYEVCDMLSSGGQKHQDREQFVPYVTKGDQWAATCYVKQQGFGGVMVWTPDDDDFSGSSCQEGKYPLMTAIIKELNNPSFANCPG
ncbi:probable chitinase 10 [Pomacea canaliculata]|uniref:probable chitinase 10 n=1 Tax=Pomacea canaliculata TaxID=400727 RepID=UPI000D73D141|nr:probable chitinase 10 [Pomacea canaliculata]